MVNNPIYSFEILIKTLRDSIFTWEYFTDFDKVKRNIRDIKIELNILNSLIGEENLEKSFIDLIRKYPNVRKVLPILIAVRENKLEDISIISNSNILTSEYKKYIFYDNLNHEIESELLMFFKESGLKDIFQNKDIKSVVDYCFGIEVGLDTNARKNRTGKIMENLVSDYLNSFCLDNRFKYISQATKNKLKEAFNVNLKLDKNNRKFDFALFDELTKKIFLIEVNFYSSGGSKLKATAGEYQYLNDFLKKQNINFIWITDGKGWLTALNPLEETFNHNDYVINLYMLTKGILEDICKK